MIAALLGLLGIFVFGYRLVLRRLDMDPFEDKRYRSPLGHDTCVILFATAMALLTYRLDEQADWIHLYIFCWLLLLPALSLPRIFLFLRIRSRRSSQDRLEEIQDWFRQGLLDFSEGVVSEVMVPIGDVFMVSNHCQIKDILEDEDYKPYSRIPVFSGDRHNIVGVIYCKDLIREGLKQSRVNPASLSVTKLARDVFFVPEVMEQIELLRQFQSKRIQLAVAVDEYGVVSGIVTLEDLLETVIGEIRDKRNDSEELIVSAGKREWTLDARMDLETFSELVDQEFDSDAVETLGGLVFLQFGSLPESGQSITLNGFEFVILEMDGYRIKQIFVRECDK